jgi:hypothetical protein
VSLSPTPESINGLLGAITPRRKKAEEVGHADVARAIEVRGARSTRSPYGKEGEEIGHADIARAVEVSRARSRARRILAFDAVTLIGAAE